MLVLGTEPMEELRKLKLVPGNRGIMSLRTELLSLPNFPGCLMLSYSPGVVDTDTKMHTDLLVDFMMMARFAATGSPKPKLGDYQWVNDFSEEIGRIKMAYAKTGKPVKVGMDTETTGKVPYGPGKHFVTIQVAIEPGRSRMVYFKDRAAQDAWLAQYRWQLDWLLNADELWTIFANGKYDLNWFWVMSALKCKNFRFDTTGVGSLLDENRSNSLNIHTKLMAPELGGYDDELEAKYDKAFMEKVPLEDLLPYAGGDPDATLRVAAVEREQLLKDPALTKFYVNIMHPANRAYEAIEQGGVLVDMEAYSELSQKLHLRMNEIIKGVREVIGPTLWDKHKDDTKVGGINLTKASLINDFLFSPGGCNLKPEMRTAKSGEPSTAKEHVLMFEKCGNKDAEAFVKVFSDFSGTSKMLSTYVTGFLKHIRSDGRFHPSYYLFAGDKDENEGGTVTGRLSCKDPAFQTIPQHTEWTNDIRRCFPAPPGFRIVGKDYSQGELRILACVAMEPTMLEAYRNDIDMHALTGGHVNGYTYEQMLELAKTDKVLWKKIRQGGKAGNFGLIYLVSPAGYQAYAHAKYGVDMTITKAQEDHAAFFQKYPGITSFHQQYIKYAREYGCVPSPLGRIRHLPLINSPIRAMATYAERQAVNAPIQSTLNDMMLWALGIAHERGWDVECPCFGTVHDAGYNYVPEDNWEFYVKRDKEMMENLPFEKVGWKPALPFPVDVKIGPNLADLKEVEFAA